MVWSTQGEQSTFLEKKKKFNPGREECEQDAEWSGPDILGTSLSQNTANIHKSTENGILNRHAPFASSTILTNLVHLYPHPLPHPTEYSEANPSCRSFHPFYEDTDVAQ